MSQPTLTEHESDDEQESDCVVCPACDYTSDTHEGFEFTTQKVVIVSIQGTQQLLASGRTD
jgi:hypothetical protein